MVWRISVGTSVGRGHLASETPRLSDAWGTRMRSCVVRESVVLVHDLVGRLDSFDQLESEHRADTLRWLEGTDDVFRRSKPDVLEPRLVSYFILRDLGYGGYCLSITSRPASGSRQAAISNQMRIPEIWPSGSAGKNSEPDGSFAVDLHQPFFLTVTETVGVGAGHTDVSLRFVFEGSIGSTFTIDEAEFPRSALVVNCRG